MQRQIMVAITLPDGNVRTFDTSVTGADLARSISTSLAKAALAVLVDGEMRDLNRVIEHDAAVSILTARDDAALELLRHDAAHVMAQAVQELAGQPFFRRFIRCLVRQRQD
jgi:threonyl-tRNA synthetase